jgi:single-strand DNA-binding protein
MLQITAIGFLGNDATVTEKPEQSVINFSIAHTRKWKNAKGEPQEKTTWIQCNYWVKKTDIVNYLKKGTMVVVQGEPSTYYYIGKDDRPQTVLQCNCETVQLLSSKNEGK